MIGVRVACPSGITANRTQLTRSSSITISVVSKEWNQMVRLAERIKKNPNTEWADQQRRRFTGIYKRLLDDENPQRVKS